MCTVACVCVCVCAQLGKLEFATVSDQAAEILVALKKLGEPLEPKEETFLKKHTNATLREFESVSDSSGDVVTSLPQVQQ